MISVGTDQSKKRSKKYQLPNKLDEIKNLPFATWKQQVTTALEKDPRNRLKEEFHKKVDGQSIAKTKTLTILPELDERYYKRKPKDEI